MAPKLQDFEEFCVSQANVNAQWLPGNNAFWYSRKIATTGKFQFMFVDCESGVRGLAFDHEKLGAGLRRKYPGKKLEDIDADALPFSWINIARDQSWVRFRFDDQTWEYRADEDESREISPWHGEFDTGGFNEGCKQEPSPWSTKESSITFFNNTSQPVTYAWVHNNGNVIQFGSVAPGQQITEHSMAGHIWRMAIEGIDKSIACAVKEKPCVAGVFEMSGRLMLKWENKDDTESSLQNEHEASSAKPETKVSVKDHNLWIKDADGAEAKMTHYGFAQNKFEDGRLYENPDGQYLVAWQCVPETDHPIHMIESSPKDQLQPQLHTEQYLRPGDNVKIERPRLFNLKNRSEVPVENSLFENPYAIYNVGWSDDGRRYRFIFNQRGHKFLRLLEIDLGGNVKVLAEEKSETFVDYNHKRYYKIMESRNEFLWASERDGWNHLYLFELDSGRLKAQVTEGEWVVRSVESVDEDKGVVWLRCFGLTPDEDPYYAHLARVDLDGLNFQILTQGNGTHTWKWSPDKRFLIDTWSRVDLPPQTVLRNAYTGAKILELEQSQSKLLEESEWVSPERFVSPGRDGKTKIYGFIARPTDMDPSKKYPILEIIYAGPQDFYTLKGFQSFQKVRERADKGYVLVFIDGMGTNWRSKAFHDVCYKNLKDGGIPDRIAWIRKAAETRPWMDLSRIGCYGGSAGGQNAAAAVLHHGDFYKAAVASAGCHDNRTDKLWWNELWMGWPVDASYEDSSNVTHAHKLGGDSALMLIVGEMDTNVNYTSTMQFAKALIDADKDFELVFVPSGEHHLLNMPWVMRKLDNFFKQHLLDRVPK